MLWSTTASKDSLIYDRENKKVTLIHSLNPVWRIWLHKVIAIHVKYECG